MAKRKKGDVLPAVEAMEMDDALDDVLAMSDEEIAAELRAAGADPDAIGRAGASHAAKHEARLGRLGWQAAARTRLETARAAAAGVPKTPKLPRVELLARLDAARRDGRFAAPLAAAFRKRDAEQSSDEELCALLDEIAALDAIASAEGKGTKGEGGGKR